MWAHRVVQEAMNYHSSRDLQECFDSAAALVYEAFPKQIDGDYFSDQWGACQTYISQGVHLSFQFHRHNQSRSEVPNLKGQVSSARSRLKSQTNFSNLGLLYLFTSCQTALGTYTRSATITCALSLSTLRGMLVITKAHCSMQASVILQVLLAMS